MTAARHERQTPSTERSKQDRPPRSPRASRSAPTSASRTSDHAVGITGLRLDNRRACFETAAWRPPQDEEFFYIPPRTHLMLKNAQRACPRLELGACLEARTTAMQRGSFRRGSQELSKNKWRNVRYISVRAARAESSTRPSALCIVSPTSTYSATGQWARMNRASEVPPVVLSSCVLPLIPRIASARQSLSIPGATTNASPLTEISSA